MSFDILMQVNNSPVEKIGKSLTTHATWQGTLRENCSIQNPVILVQSSDLVSLVNYCTIPSFGRSYFVRDIVNLRNNMCEIHCHVDVLESFKSQILANSGIIRRQQNNWNLYLDDGSLKAYQNPIVNTLTFPSGFSGSEFVMAIAGR